MVKKDHQKTKVEVGEIDTSKPFQSVRAAVSLFGESAFPGGTTIKKLKPQPAERLLVRETLARWAGKDLNKLREKVENAEITKARALLELEKAKQVVEDLNGKLKRSKDLPSHASVAKDQASRFSEGAGDKSVGYSGSIVTQLDLAEQELRKLCLEYNASAEGNKDRQKQLHKVRLKESAQNLLALKEDIDPQVTKMDNSRAANLDSVRTVTKGLDGAKESLNRTAEEKRLLRSLVESLKLELEIVVKEHSEVEEKMTETESTANNLQAEVEKVKSELEAALAGKARGVSDGTVEAEELKRQADAMRVELEEAEEKLRVALHEAERVKAAELTALDQIKVLSERTDVMHAPMPEPGSLITMPRDEFESLSWKVEEFKNIGDTTIAAAMALVEAAKATDNEDLERLKALQKEIHSIQAATQEALNKSDTAESAKRSAGGELRRWHGREQIKAAATASGILGETDEPFHSSLKIYHILRQRSLEKETEKETRKLATTRTSVAKRVLMPNLSRVLGKKGRVKGCSPSNLPSKKPFW